MSVATEGTPEFYEKGDLLPGLRKTPPGTTRLRIQWTDVREVFNADINANPTIETAIATRIPGTYSWAIESGRVPRKSFDQMVGGK